MRCWFVSVTAASWAFYWFSGIFMTRPLFAKYDQFHDLTNYIDKTAHLYRGAAALGAGLPIFTYPAPAAFVYKLLLYPFPGHPVRPFLTFLTICIVGFAFVAWRACRPGRAVRLSAAAAIVVTAVLGYPMWFVADRGNIRGRCLGAGRCWPLLTSAGENPLSSSADRALAAIDHLPSFFFCSCCAIAGTRRRRLEWQPLA